MDKGSTLFLKTVILLIAVGVITGMLWFPQIEGRNANADFMQIYFQDPFLAYAYIASLPFFGALYQAFKLLGFIEQNKAFSQISVNALRNIKNCAIALSCLVAGSNAFILFTGEEDGAGAMMIGFIIIFASFVIATAAAVFQKLLQNAVDIKSENDLTV